MPRRSATETERALWRAAMRGVERLNGPDLPPQPAAVPAREEPDAPAVAVAPPPSPSSSKPGAVDRATLERLRRGQIAIDGRIDLHGITQAEAFSALMGFVAASLHRGKRALLVITGKGALSQGGGVLRRHAPSWLLASPFAPRILTVAGAHLRHGGDGAFYVLLRRTKPRP